MSMKKEYILSVVGYPKSGNTWLLRMLCDLLDANIDAEDEVNRAYYRQDSTRLLRKLHFSDPNLVGEDEKIIYIVRDVRDVLVSAFFHINRFVPEASLTAPSTGPLGHVLKWYFKSEVLRLNKCWRDNFYQKIMQVLWQVGWRKSTALHKNKTQFHKNWTDHVSVWMRNDKIIVVKYEDLRVAPENVLRNVMAQLGEPVDEEKLKRAVRRHDFNNERRRFEAHGDILNAKFMRSGTVGDWARFFDKDILEKVIAEHHIGLHIAGYLKEEECPYCSSNPVSVSSFGLEE